MNIWNSFLNLLYPPKCVFCRRILEHDEYGICRSCRSQYREPIEPLTGNAFRKCAIALNYDGEVREAITRFKFADRPEYAEHFGVLIAKAVLREIPEGCDLISWIPVSEKRLKTRGYDQARLLAEAAAAVLDAQPVSTLKKVRHNAAQSGMENSARRKENVKGAYLPENPEMIEGRKILLIDDIITTGATMEEAASALLAGGAEAVYCAALAHPAKKF